LHINGQWIHEQLVLLHRSQQKLQNFIIQAQTDKHMKTGAAGPTTAHLRSAPIPNAATLAGPQHPFAIVRSNH
jgi:hypothetical protein